MINKLRKVCLFIGVAIFLICIFELGLFIIFSIKDLTTSTDYRVYADGYEGVGWAKDLFKEFKKVSVEWAPYIHYCHSDLYGEYINIRNGHRVTWNSTSKAQKKIFMFGGSTMWGTGARDYYTIPSYVAKMLHNKKINVEVLNFGTLGYVNSQEIIQLIQELKRGNIPDFVVFYDGVNEVFSSYQTNGKYDLQNAINRISEFNILKDNRRIIMALFKKTHINRFLLDIIRYMRLSRQKTTFDSQLARKVSDKFIMNFRFVEKLSEIYNFDFLFIWQPAVFFKTPLTEYEQREFNRFSWCKNLYQEVPVWNERLKNNRYMDLSDIFVGCAFPVFIDHGHILEKGNKIIAARIVDLIIKELKQQKDN